MGVSIIFLSMRYQSDVDKVDDVISETTYKIVFYLAIMIKWCRFLIILFILLHIFIFADELFIRWQLIHHLYNKRHVTLDVVCILSLFLPSNITLTLNTTKRFWCFWFLHNFVDFPFHHQINDLSVLLTNSFEGFQTQFQNSRICLVSGFSNTISKFSVVNNRLIHINRVLDSMSILIDFRD